MVLAIFGLIGVVVGALLTLSKEWCFHLPWSFERYGSPHHIDSRAIVRVLTPWSIVRALAEGFRPKIHPSATPGGFF